jgi:hypothetical protein
LDVGKARVRSDGNVLWQAYSTVSTQSPQGFPDIAYNMAADHYLLVGSYEWASGKEDIYGVLLDYDGSKKGNVLGIATAPGRERHPAVCSNEQDSFMVTWVDDSSGDWDVRAARLNLSGTKLESKLLVATSADNEYNPDVAAASGGTEYLFVWERFIPSANLNIEARRYDSTANMGDIFEVSSPDFTFSNRYPAVGSHPGGFLVVFEYTPSTPGADSDIYGELY